MKNSVATILVSLCAFYLNAQIPLPPNDDEGQVPDYQLGDPLVFENGTVLKGPEDWPQRRTELLGLFEEHMYGKAPGKPNKSYYEVQRTDSMALDGTAIRKEVRLIFSTPKGIHQAHLLLFLPKDAQGPAPLVLGLNFYGNHTIHPDPDISLPTGWIKNNIPFGIDKNIATEASRGVRAYRWPVARILERGYGLATMHYGDFDPDRPHNFKDGVHPLFYEKDQKYPKTGEWGAIAAWAWGLRRAMDYLETDAAINAKAIAVFGHSRLGKAALWAGALDDRFALVISNNSGCGGAALSKRRFGETLNIINTAFPHWFNDRFVIYNNNETALPIDQHLLISAIAPRPAYVASAVEDTWADPKGEFLSLVHADPVYRLLKLPGLPSKEIPALQSPIMGSLGYHIRSGGHDVTDYDWERFLDFADKHLK